jgi:hypothetical protein
MLDRMVGYPEVQIEFSMRVLLAKLGGSYERDGVAQDLEQIDFQRYNAGDHQVAYGQAVYGCYRRMQGRTGAADILEVLESFRGTRSQVENLNQRCANLNGTTTPEGSGPPSRSLIPRPRPTGSGG